MVYTLQYASNFFLNLHKNQNFKRILDPVSPNLALLGNICSLDTRESINIYKNFLDYCSKNYKNVYLVPGVWEHSSHTPQHYEKMLFNLYNLKKQYKNITILNNSYVQIPNTNINLIGSTLWMRNPYLNNIFMFEYNYLYMNRHSGLGNVMGNDMVNWHMEDLYHIREMLKSNKKFIVLTHHLPNHVLIKDISRKVMESSNLEKYMKKPIEIWVGGAGDRTISGTFGYCNDIFTCVNPYTTFNKKMNESYDPCAYISLRTDSPELV